MEKTHDEEMAIDLWELISALKKRALIILAACLLGGVVAGVYTKLCITPMYTATSSMLVTTQETTLTSIADLQLGSALTGDYSILATSRSVLEEVIEDLGLNMNHHQLRGSITITNPEGTHIMEVTARSSDPETAKKDCGHYGGCFSAVYKSKKWRWLLLRSSKRRKFRHPRSARV